MSGIIKARISRPRITATIKPPAKINARIGGARVTINGGSSDQSYTHTQSVASNLWNVHHNLGKIPSVTVVDSSGSEWWVEVRNIDINNLQIVLTNAMGGYAYCN